jgi:putative nucleotidyltransferase with HDIG domain
VTPDDAVNLLAAASLRQSEAREDGRSDYEKGRRDVHRCREVMTRRRVFGSHLYYQIVIPLLLASVVVGLVATTAAVLYSRDLARRWITQVADSVTSNLVSTYARYADQMQRVAWLTASDPALQQAARTGDAAYLRSSLSVVNAALTYDELMVLDESGTVLASVGNYAFPAGSRPLGNLGAATPGVGRSLRTVFVRFGEEGALVALQPVSDMNGRYYSFGVARRVTDEFLGSLGGSTGSAFCLYSSDKRMVACSEAPTLSDRDAGALRAALAEGNSPVTQALAQTNGGTQGVGHFGVNGTNYEVLARRIVLPGHSDGQAGDLGYAVGVVSQAVSDQAARTTTNLIIVWSVFAVVGLVGLGGWVARSVSEPLGELSEGAMRVADGDFSTKVEIHGENEVAQLGTAFNEMTDSLRDRSESLTKKVLELATLYEMSRALGSTLDMDELLGSVLDSALRIFDLDLGYVALRDKETNTLSVRAIRGVDSPASDAVRSTMSEWVVREGRPLIFNPDPSAGEGQVDAVTGARAALCVPLVSSEGTIGSITVGSADSDYRFNSDDVRLLSTIANHVAIAVGNIELFSSLQEAYLATVRSLAAAVDAKDTYTRGHSDRVAAYATLIAERLGVSHEQRIALEMAAYLHDIGKIGVAEEILLKPGKLTSDEMEEMRHHPLIGANILKPVAFPWAITPIVRHHHEHFDGSGYPAGLKAEEIPLLARILTAADSYEAMTADRPYREGLSDEAALVELRRCSGTQFDPRIVEALVGIVEEDQAAEKNVSTEASSEISHEEARAIFAALVDGVFSSFRRLGGPRLASNVESDMDRQFTAHKWPFRVSHGRVSFNEPVAADSGAELAHMRDAMRALDRTLGRVSGSTLVDHFYTDAYEGFSERLRRLSDELGFRSHS